MLAEHLTNLPARRTALIGRERDLAAVRELVLGSAGRLVTLTGAGGAGKTSLALQLARALAPAVPDGTWLVELAPLADPQLVPQAVAAALGVQTGASRSPEQAWSPRCGPGRCSCCWTTANISSTPAPASPRP